MRFLVIATSIFTIAVLAAPVHGEDPPTEVIVEVERVCGPRSEPCSLAYKRMRRLAYLRRVRNRQLTRVLRSEPSVDEAINLAAITYSVSGAMLHRKAYCESRKYPRARNLSSSASGLFQFLSSTWRSTPYAGFSVWSPYANSLAAGWMHKVGRGGEWVCQ